MATLTGCLGHQASFDKGVLTFKTWADDKIQETTRRNQKLTFCDSIIPRLLYVAQAIGCAVVGIFKGIFAIFASIYAQWNSKDSKAVASGAYAVVSAGAYAAAVPTLLSAAFGPTKNLVLVSSVTKELHEKGLGVLNQEVARPA